MNGGGYEGGENLQDFYAEVDQLREGIEKVNANISNIESLHARSLKDIDEQTSAQTQSQLNSIVAETSSLNKNLTQRIKILKGKAGRDPSKGPQVGVLDRNFKDALRRYQMVEKTFADRTREQMARQYRIVRPEATEDEVREACEGEQGQVFSQALLRGNRRGEARSALQEVQNRHNEIQKIEKTIIELATLFNEMEQLVAEQETMVEHIDQQGEEVQENVGKAQEEIGQAVEKARSRRRKKWWCMLIVRKCNSLFSHLLLFSFTLFHLAYTIHFASFEHVYLRRFHMERHALTKLVWRTSGGPSCKYSTHHHRCRCDSPCGYQSQQNVVNAWEEMDLMKYWHLISRHSLVIECFMCFVYNVRAWCHEFVAFAVVRILIGRLSRQLLHFSFLVTYFFGNLDLTLWKFVI
ncbi:t-SNARE [Geopyxis carbonaria]|nr:t-SNARE [Geopyxis carbonaria]